MPSNVIAEMNYDPQHRTLSIRFRPSGRRYDYFKVPFEEYDALRHARSKGQFFNRHIRDHYDCVLVEEPAAETPPGPTSPTMPEPYHPTVTRG